MNKINISDITIELSGAQRSDLKVLGRVTMDDTYRRASDDAETEFLAAYRRKEMQRQARERQLGRQGFLRHLRGNK